MRNYCFHLRLIFLLMLAVSALALGGCSTTDSANMSERPWDSPKGWENGMPSSMMEGR